MIHHVFANKSNIGDWLSALGIQSLLPPHSVREHLCDEPFVAQTLAALSRAQTGDVIVIGGGGLFMDYFLPFWQGFREIAGRTPFCIWGVGYCDLKREMSRPGADLLTEIIGQSRLCSVRDELTRRWLLECHLPPPTACPSLCVLAPPSEPGFGILHVDNYTTAGADVYECMDACARRFAETTQRPFRRTNNRITAGRTEDLAEVLARYASSDVVLSSALHGCIIGLAMGKKVLAVSGDYKIESFMNEVGMGDWVSGIEEVDDIPRRLEALDELPRMQASLDHLRAANRKIARQILVTCREIAETTGGSQNTFSRREKE